MNEKDKRLERFQHLYSNEVVGLKSDQINDLYGFWATRPHKTSNYDAQKIEEIIQNGSIEEKRRLSRDFFETNGNYRSIILYYATLLYYYWYITPQAQSQSTITKKKYTKKYDEVLNFISRSQVEGLNANWAVNVLRDGIYYGVVSSINNEKMVVINLPPEYCRSNYVDLNGNEIIEFDLAYFDKFADSDLQKTILNSYPKYIQKAYRVYKNKDSQYKYKYYMIPSDFGICFSLFGAEPLFVTAIPSVKQYKDAVEIEQLRDIEEIRKIIVQHVPHITSTGDLVFEPEEAELMHQGAVDMMKKNENVSVLTTYADVDAIVSKTSADTASNNLEKMLNNVYSQVGVSGQLFSLAGAASLKYSMNKDLALMMVLASKFMNCITNLINFQFGDNKVTYTYNILPIAEYNKNDYVNNYIKMASLGYSFLMPAIAMGINQRDLITLKTIENDVLQLETVLKPLSSSYNSNNAGAGDGNVGRPAKENEDKAPKTLQNEDSINNQGG